ncbi:MAG: ThuA domain-containing protein [Planctomycetaceae bacterium]|nr:ThuA domain-containing protein [Planctomycetaceae bacterium]
MLRPPTVIRILIGAALLALALRAGLPAAAQLAPPSRRILIVTGHQHGAHNWREVTDALVAALRRDQALEITVGNPDSLANPRLAEYGAVVLNYCNWERPGLPPAAQKNFQKYLAEGGGLVILHFSNGAFHFSLPGAEKTDWPEWRTKICRRVWDHTPGKSGHDAYGRFRVEIVKPDHPITRGLEPFETIDELYFNQQGSEPIEVLATARSQVTGKDEPMAFVCSYGQGRVFQTVLGHAAESVRVPAVAELILRGTVWAAGGNPRSGPVPAAPPGPAQSRAAPGPLVPGKFGQALLAAKHFARTEPLPEFARRPLTIECWARLDSAQAFNILVAQQPKESAGHWELYTYAGAGDLSLFLPGYTPAEIRSGVVVTDNQWHYLAAQFDQQVARLFVDGRQVCETPIARQRDDVRPGPLWIGGYPPHGLACAGAIDSVRLSSSLRPVSGLPAAPLAVDEQSLGLWQFDALDTKSNAFADASPRQHPALLNAAWAPAAEPLVYGSADPRCRVVTIDRSSTESFLSLRLDTAGRLFVGGREALFVYEPAAAGAYAPRHELFRFPPHSWITDIEIRGDDLYVTTASALYVLPGARVRRDAVEARRLIWGLPLDLHVTMHGLAWGPDGDLYFAAGDPLLNYGDFKRPDHWGHWTLFGPNGKQTPYTGAGGVFRCRPDGTGLQVLARGLRGCDGLAFDRGWNLFTNDNDHESLAASYSPARLLHVTREADFQWPRGWMPEKSPDRRDLLEIVNTQMQRGVPVGQAYYDEPLLPEDLRHNLLVARWDNRTVGRYPLVSRGASFSAGEHPLVVGENTARPVGVAVGRGGRVFFAVSNMQGNEGSPTYASEIAMLVPADDPPAHPFDSSEVTALDASVLLDELASPSYQRRAAAHLELTRRELPAASVLLERSRQLSTDSPAAAHLPWIVARLGTPESVTELQRIVQELPGAARLQAVRALGRYARDKLPETYFAERLDDRDPQVQLAALESLFDYPGPPPEAVVAGPARSSDSYLRQTAATLLARRGDAALLQQLARSPDAAMRLAAVLAAGIRLTVPPATHPLPDEIPLKYEHGNASFVIQYADALVDLKQQGRVGSFTIAEIWRQFPHSEQQQELFALLQGSLNDADDQVALQGAYYLSLLNDASTEPAIVAARQRIERARLLAAPRGAVDRAWYLGPLAVDTENPSAAGLPEAGPIDLTAEFQSGGQKLAWRELAASADGKFSPAVAAGQNRAAHYLYCRLQTSRAQRALLEASGADSISLWHNGRKLAGAGGEQVVELQPGSNDLLLRIETRNSSPQIALSYRAADAVAVVLPERLGLGTLAARLKEAAGAGDKPLGPEFLEVDWQQAARQGDSARGRKLFGADALGCVKCHAITLEQVVAGGPSLAGAKARFTVPHLVESILAPSRQVAPVFRASTIVTSDGRIHTGLVLTEDQQQLELLLADATRKPIAKNAIDERELQPTSPMPNGLIKTPDELRDLLAYLLSDSPQAP